MSFALYLRQKAENHYMAICQYEPTLKYGSCIFVLHLQISCMICDSGCGTWMNSATYRTCTDDPQRSVMERLARQRHNVCASMLSATVVPNHKTTRP